MVRLTMLMKVFALSAACLCLLIGSIQAQAQDTIYASNRIMIGQAHDATAGSSIEIPVYKMTGSDPIGGFDFTIAYDTLMAELIDLVPSEVFDVQGNYRWELLHYSEELGQINIKAIADIANGDIHPGTLVLPDSILLFTMVFNVSPAAPACEFIPINFYWNGCGDNAISDPTGYYLLVSQNVFQLDNGYHIVSDPNMPLPSPFGAPDNCISPGVIDRGIDLFGGGFDVLCETPAVLIGDVNLNGIPYEIADEILFKDWFYYGHGAFGDNPQQSLQATDVNYDKRPGDLEDLILMHRIIKGDLPPLTGPIPMDSVITTLIQNVQNKTVTLQYDNTLAAIYLVFQGLVEPTLQIAGAGDALATWVRYDSGMTFIMAFPNNYSSQFEFTGADFSLNYLGDGTLISAQAADFHENHWIINQIQVNGVEPENPILIAIDGMQPPVTSQISVAVVKVAGAPTIHGFDFLIKYDQSKLSLAGVEAGLLFDPAGDFRWEYFDYRDDAASGFVRAVAVADKLDANNDHPLSFDVPDGTVIYNLTFDILNYPDNLPGTTGLNFIWLDCGDNLIATAEGDAYFSNHVFDGNGIEVTNLMASFPTYGGAPAECSSPEPPPNGSRMIDFHSVKVEVPGNGSGPDLPHFEPIPTQYGTVGELMQFMVNTTWTSPPIIFSANLPSGATLENHNDYSATFSWIPGVDDAGNHEVNFIAMDSEDTTLMGMATATIIVQGDNTQDQAFSISIDDNLQATDGETISIPVRKTSGPLPTAAFEYTIGYDNTNLTLTGCTPGPIFDANGEYQWEFFHWAADVPGDCALPDCPSGVVSVLGLSETYGNPHQVLRFDIPDGTILFTLDFAVLSNVVGDTIFQPLKFYWNDCTSNSMSSLFGDSLLVTRHVYDSWGNDITDYSHGLPSYFGSPDLCGFTGNGPYRLIDFVDGGIYLKGLPCGDCNNDGKLNIVDASYIINYIFYEGPDPTMGRSDVNNDKNINVVDASFIINYIFFQGPSPGCDP